MLNFSMHRNQFNQDYTYYNFIINKRLHFPVPVKNLNVRELDPNRNAFVAINFPTINNNYLSDSTLPVRIVNVKDSNSFPLVLKNAECGGYREEKVI